MPPCRPRSPCLFTCDLLSHTDFSRKKRLNAIGLVSLGVSCNSTRSTVLCGKYAFPFLFPWRGLFLSPPCLLALGGSASLAVKFLARDITKKGLPSPASGQKGKRGQIAISVLPCTVSFVIGWAFPSKT